jgi:hypothetical protein
MDRKVLAILMIFLAGASFLTMGCAGKRNNNPAAPTIAAPTALTNTTSNPTASDATGIPVASGVPTVTAVPAQANTSSNSLGLDPSIANISGEDDDESYPESGLPTPNID